MCDIRGRVGQNLFLLWARNKYYYVTTAENDVVECKGRSDERVVSFSKRCAVLASFVVSLYQNTLEQKNCQNWYTQNMHKICSPSLAKISASYSSAQNLCTQIILYYYHLRRFRIFLDNNLFSSHKNNRFLKTNV